MKASRKERVNIKASKIVKGLNIRTLNIDTISQTFRCYKCGKHLIYGMDVLAWNTGYGTFISCKKCTTPLEIISYNLSKKLMISEIKAINIYTIAKAVMK